MLAVRQKYSDDQGGYLAVTVTYYGFFSIFPLLLVAATILGFVVSGNGHLRRSIVGSALGQFPLIGHELKVLSLHGSALALGVGVVLSLWSGMGVFLAAAHAMDRLWGIPFRRRPDFFRSRARALGLLLVLGGGVLGTTVLSSAGPHHAAGGGGERRRDAQAVAPQLLGHPRAAREGRGAADGRAGVRRLPPG